MSEKRPMPYGLEFQMGVIKLMSQDDAFCSKACVHLFAEYFTGELKWFFKNAFDHYQAFRRPPTMADFQTDINKHYPEKQQEYCNLLVKIFNTNVSIDKVKRELTGFVRANIFVGAYHKAAPLFNQGSYKDAYDVTQRELEKLQRVDFEQERTVRFGDHESLIDTASDQAKEAIPTGIVAIDEAIGGGLLPQTWTTFLGGSNSGKSMLCPSLAFFAMLKGKRTFVTVHEDEELPTKLRYLSRFSGVEYTKLTYGRQFLTDDEKARIRHADELLSKFVVLRFMYLDEATVEKVGEAARLLMKEWKFDLFLCDYGQCLQTARFKTLDNIRIVQEYVYHQLKQLCLELNIAGAGGAQVNRAGHALNKSGADWLRCTDVAEAFGIVRKSSNVITINRSEEDIKNDRIVFLLDKVRNGRCPIAVECVTKFASCATHIDPSNAVDPDKKLQTEIPVSGGPGGEPKEKEGDTASV
jgi:hypothetical protein